jgi:hypothetical protein
MEAVMRYQRQDSLQANVARGDRRFSVGNFVSSAVVALVIAYSSLAAPLTSVGGHAQPLATLISDAVDRTHKGDRGVQAGATFAARWNIQDRSVGDDFRPARFETPMERQMKAKIPFGCDPAFGPLVHANFSARCLASSEGRAKLASKYFSAFA